MADDAPSFDTPPAALDQLTQARADGHEWGDINSHLAQGSLDAHNEGYTQQEIDTHLGYNTGDFHPAMKQLATARLSDDPDVLNDIHSGSPFELPAMREDYAAALMNGTAKGPNDYASGVAAATLDAAHNALGLDDSDPAMTRRRAAMAQDAADGLAETLPRPGDLVDAALHLSNGDPEPTPWLMKNLLDHWTDTGQEPVQAAMAAGDNPVLRDKLARPPEYSAFPEGVTPTLADLSQKGRDAIEKFYLVPGEELVDAKSFNEVLADVGMDAAQILGFKAAGYAAKEIGLPLAKLAMEKLGRIPDWIEDWVGNAKVKVTDLADTAASKELSPAEAFKQAEPAELLKPANAAEEPAQGARSPKQIMAEQNPPPYTIDPVASPASKLQRILQLQDERATENANVGSSTFFQDLIARGEREGVLQPDTELTKLAEAHDTSRNMLSTFRDLMGSEEGKVSIPSYRTPKEIAERDAFTGSRDYARDMLTKTQGNVDRLNANWSKQLEPFHKLENANRAEWDAELAKGPAGSPMTTKLGQTLDYMEGRSAGVTLANNEFKPFADTVRNINQELDSQLRQRDLDGTITYKGYIQDHVRHFVLNPAKAEETFLGGGKFGDRGTLKERKYPTYGDAIAAGLEPKYNSVIEGELRNAAGTTTFMHYADMLKEMRENYGKGGPGLYWDFKPRGANDVAIDHPIGRNAIPMEKTVAQQAAAVQARAARNAEVAAIKAKVNNGYPASQGTAEIAAARAKYNPVIEAGAPDARIQSLYGNRGLVQELNKWSAQRFNTQTGADIYGAMMKAKNMSTAMKLLLPLAHAGQVVIGTAAHGFGQAMEEASRGQLLRAAWNAGKSATFVGQAADRYLRGQFKIIPDYVKLKNDPALQYLTDAGFRPVNPREASGEAIGGGNLWTALRQGALAREFKEDVRGIFGDPKTETDFKRFVRAPDRVLQFGFKEAQRLMTTATAPMFDHAIPAIKAGATYDRFNSWLEANLGASHEAKMLKAQQIVAAVDNNLGELNLNNVFWNKTIKQSMNVSMLSSSWTLGTMRAIGSALGYNIDRQRFEGNLVAANTLIGFGVSYVLANNIMQYLHTGTLPILGMEGTQWQDNFNYKTGTGKRGFIFSEIKEVYDLGKVLMTAAGRHDITAAGPAFADYALGKLNPVFRFFHDFFKGEDATGHKISNTPHGWLGYLNENFGPIFTQSFDKLKKGTGLTAAEIALGWREAPTYVADPDKFFGQQKGLMDKWTKEELRRAQRENAQLENPDPTIASSNTGGTGHGGSNAGVQQKRSADFQARPGDSTTAQNRSLDYQPRAGDATGSQARSLDYQPRPDVGPAPAPARSGGAARGSSRGGGTGRRGGNPRRRF